MALWDSNWQPSAQSQAFLPLHLRRGGGGGVGGGGGSGGVKVLGKLPVPEHPTTIMCLSIETPKYNKFSICFKWKIYNF